jgi:hypothetical protein
MKLLSEWNLNVRGKAKDAFAGTNYAIRCYESHPALKLGKGTLYGGSARFPVKGADIYVVLQAGDMNGYQSDPWEKQKVVEIGYLIPDMQAPPNVPRFQKLVTWLCTQLQAGKTVHVGCIGGHGRTGTLISAIVAELGTKDAIQWVRKHYCSKAVESPAQVAFLQKHYGVSAVEPAKKPVVVTAKGRSDAEWSQQYDTFTESLKASAGVVSQRVVRKLPEGASKASKSYSPIASARSLWKEKKKR